jgi:hypothetical protein
MAEPVEATKVAKKKPATGCDGSYECRRKQMEELLDHYKVPKGQLTFDAEGTEGGRYHSRHAHWPGGKSGVTLGRGYDMGDRTPAQVTSDLTAAGMDPAVAQQYADGAGKKGPDAQTWVNNNRDNITQITPEQQKKLFASTYAEHEADAKRLATKADVTKKYGATCWENLDPKIKDTLVDLRYRGDYTGTTREFLQDSVVANDPEAFGAEMRDPSNWTSVPPDRFNRRSDYWQ